MPVEVDDCKLVKGSSCRTGGGSKVSILDTRVVRLIQVREDLECLQRLSAILDRLDDVKYLLNRREIVKSSQIMSLSFRQLIYAGLAPM